MKTLALFSLMVSCSLVAQVQHQAHAESMPTSADTAAPAVYESTDSISLNKPTFPSCGTLAHKIVDMAIYNPMAPANKEDDQRGLQTESLISSPALEIAQEWAGKPLTEGAAVHIALVNNPHLQSRLIALGVRDVQQLLQSMVSELPSWLDGNPDGAEADQQRHSEEALSAAQEALTLAAGTRRAWLRAMAAQQVVEVQERMYESAQIGAELAHRMASIGNWSRLQQAHECTMLADSAQQLARARLTAAFEREELNRRLGVWGMQKPYMLPPHLPAMPSSPRSADGLEALALRERLDLRAAQAQPTIDARSPQQLAHQQAMLLARSEVRIAWQTYRVLYDIARQQRDQIVPLRQLISDETLLRYNGMLASVWDLLGQARNASRAVSDAILAQRDFWLADTNLQLSLLTTLPDALPRVSSDESVSTKKPDH